MASVAAASALLTLQSILLAMFALLFRDEVLVELMVESLGKHRLVAVVIIVAVLVFVGILSSVAYLFVAAIGSTNIAFAASTMSSIFLIWVAVFLLWNIGRAHFSNLKETDR